MTIQTINIGVEGNDGTGDSIRGAFTKVNENFDYVARATGIEQGLRLRDLADAPLPDINDQVYLQDQIIMADRTGSRLIARSIVGGTNVTVNITETGEILVSAPNTKLSSDPLPKLGQPLNAMEKTIGNLSYPNQAAVDRFNSVWGGSGNGTTLDKLPVTVKYASENFLSVYDGVIGYKDATGKIVQPSLAPSAALIDTTSKDYDPSLTGNYLSTSLVPRKDLVYRGGDTMTGPLYLNNHPAPLSNIVTSDPADLQAATRLYVDTKTYASNINLYVSTSSGDDLQSNTPSGKEGRNWNYSYNTIGAALLHAQSLIELASQEPGPYKQRISYTKKADLSFSTIQKVSLTGGNSIGSNSEGYIAAYDLLQANREFIQAETIAYINRKYVNTYDYGVESTFKNKITALITAVTNDLMLGAVLSPTNNYTLNYNSYWTAIEYIKTHSDSSELVQWKSIIEFVKTQITDFSYNLENLQTYTESIVNALCYDFLFNSNYQSLQTGIAFNSANTGISSEQLTAMLIVNPITITAASYSGTKLTITFAAQPLNTFPANSKIIVNGSFTTGTNSPIQLINRAVVVDSSTETTITFITPSFTLTSPYTVTNGSFDKFNLVNQILLITEVVNSSPSGESITNNARLIASIASGSSLPTVTLPVLVYTPVGYNKTGYSNAKDLLIANISFIQSEIIAYLSAEFPLETYDRAFYTREVKYTVWSISYDLMYGGNSQSIYTAKQIVANNVSSTSFKSAMLYINVLAQLIIQNLPVATTYQQSVKQYRNNSLVGGIIASTSIATNINSMNRIVSILPSTPANVTLSVNIAGVITASAAISSIIIDQYVTISGTNTGTGVVPTGTYKIIATNGTSTFQLSDSNGLALVTGAGTLIGLTYVFLPFTPYTYSSRNTISSAITNKIPSFTVTADITETDGFASTTTPWFIDHFYPVINVSTDKSQIIKLFDFISNTITKGNYPTALPIFPGTITSVYGNTLSSAEVTSTRAAILSSLTTIVENTYTARSTYKVVGVSVDLYKQYVKDVVLAVAYNITYSGSSATLAATGFLNTVDTGPTSLITKIKSEIKLATNSALLVVSVQNGTNFTVNVNHQTSGTVTFNLGSQIDCVAILVAGVATVTLTTGNTTGIVQGSLITGASGDGRFGTNPIDTIIEAAFSTTSSPPAILLLQNAEPYKTAGKLRDMILNVTNLNTIVTDTVSYVKSNFSGGFKYNETLCYRDIGLIVNAMSIDLITAGTWQSVNAGKSFYKNASGILVASGTQRVQSLDGIKFTQELALQVLNKEYNTRYQSLVSQVSIITNVLDLPSTAIRVGRVGDTRLSLPVSILAINTFTTNFSLMYNIVENGIGFAPTVVTSMFGSGIWHVAVSNGGIGYVDQGKPNNIDIFPAKIISGVGKQSTNISASTATATIVKYVPGLDTALTIVSVEDSTNFTVSIPHKTSGFVTFAVGNLPNLGATLTAGSRTVTLSVGTVSTLNIGEAPVKSGNIGEFGITLLPEVDSIQVRLIRPDFFNLYEEVEFGETVRDLQITMFVESGIYYEDFPLRLAPNISIKGDEFRRTIIRPKDRISQSPWHKLFFYRDAIIDALEIGVVDYNGDNYAPTGVSAAISGLTSTIIVTLTSVDLAGNTVGYQALLSWVGKVFTDVNTVNGNAKRGKAVIDSVSGNTMNCTVIYPFDGPVRIIAPTFWKMFSTKNYGYHYLTDPSDQLSQAKNNKDIDVFLCNEGNRVVGLTVQGQGGFAMVLDPTGNIKTKSPYIQECSSFSQSNNYKRFAGGQYIDGFAGRISGTITQILDKGITVEVTGSALSGIDIRPPQAPCSFYVRGKRYQIDDVVSWNQIIDPLTSVVTGGVVVLTLDKSTTYLYDSNSQSIVFNLQKTKRDIRYVIDAAAADLAFGTNYRSIHAGREFLRPYSSALTGSLKDLTIAGINKAASLTALTSNATFMSNVAIMTAMIANGVVAEPTMYWTNLTTGSGYVNKNLARDIIQRNRTFIIAEISAVIAEIPGISSYKKYNVIVGERNIGYMIDAVTYDLFFGGTSQTYSSAIALRDDNTSEFLTIVSIYTAAITRLKTLMPYIVAGQTNWGSISKSVGNKELQDITVPSGVSFQSTLDPLFDLVSDYIVDGVFTPSSTQPCYATSALVSGAQVGTYSVGNLLSVAGTSAIAYVSEVSMDGKVIAVDFKGPGSNAGNFITSSPNLTGIATINSNTAVGHGEGALLTLIIGPEVFPTVTNQLYTTELAYSNITSIATNVITYLSNGADQKINIELGGNRSMLANDFAMFNDLAYGILANNGAFTEQVCTFTYYAHTGFWANNGSNLRGVGCSNSFGNYGLRASGFDVTELPDSVELANHMIQTARVYKQGETINNMVPTATVPATELWIVGYDYVPTNGSILEIDHSVNGGNIVSYIVSSVQYTTIQVSSQIVIRLNLSSSGNNGTSSTGLKTALYDGQIVTIRSSNNFKFNNIDNVKPTRPSTALQYNDNLNSVYRIVAYNLNESTGDSLPSNVAILQSDNGFNYYSLSTDTISIYAGDPTSDIVGTIVSGSLSSTTITVTIVGTVPDLTGYVITGIGFFGHTVSSILAPVGTTYTIEVSDTLLTTPYGTISFSTSTQGSKVNDTKVAVSQISNAAIINQLNKGTYITAWNGRLHRILKYVKPSFSVTGTLVDWTPNTGTVSIAGATVAVGTLIVSNEIVVDTNTLIVARTDNTASTIQFTGNVYSLVYDSNSGKTTVSVINGTLVGGAISISASAIITFGISTTSHIEFAPSAIINNNTIGNPIPAFANARTVIQDNNPFVTFDIPYNKNNLLPVVNSYVSISGTTASVYNGSYQVVNVVDQTEITIGSTSNYSVGMVVTFQIFVTDITGNSINSGKTFKTTTAHHLQINDIVRFKTTSATYGVDSTIPYYVKTIDYTTVDGVNIYDKFTVSLTSGPGNEKSNFTTGNGLTLEITTPISRNSYMNTVTNNSIVQKIVGNTLTVSPACWAPANAPVRATVAATVSSIIIKNPGSGYTSAPKLTITSGGGTAEATATCTVSLGLITQVTVVLKGSGFVSIPEVTIEPSADTNTSPGSGYVKAILVVELSTPVKKDSTATSGVTTSNITLQYPQGTVNDEIKTISSSVVASGTSYAGTIGGVTYTAVSGYVATLTVTQFASVPTAGLWYRISDSSNTLYNGLVQIVQTVSASSVEVFYKTDPGTFIGTASITKHTFDVNEVNTISSSAIATGTAYAGTLAGITYTAILGYVATLTVTAFTNIPTAGSWYLISNSSNTLYNGLVQVTELVSASSVKVFYPYDPGAFTGTASITKTSTSGTTSAIGISKPFDLNTAYTFAIGYPLQSGGQVTTRISTCRATGHDFCDIGTGGYSTTNIPYSIYGDPALSRQVSHETLDEGVGRCFYVSTNQDGIFKVGRFFSVDQGTGVVTLSSELALSNIKAFGFSTGGAVVSEFSTDSTMTDNSSNKVPVESSIRGYIDKRLGLDHGGSQMPQSSVIGPGFLPLNGLLAMTANLKMGSHSITGLAYPGSDISAAASVAYVNNKVDSKSNAYQLADIGITAAVTSQLLVFDAATLVNKWVNKTLDGNVTISYDTATGVLTSTIEDEQIVNSMVSTSAAILQSKLSLSNATTRANSTSIVQSEKGIASFNDKVFTATDGWIDLDTSTSLTTGVLLGKIQQINAKKVLGNVSSSSAIAAVAEVSVDDVVTYGDGIKNASFTAQGAMSVSSRTTVNGVTTNAYNVVAYTVTGGANSIVQTDAVGGIDVVQLKINNKLVIDSTTTKNQFYTPDGAIFLSATGTGATEANTVVSVTTLETTSRSGKIQTTKLTTGNQNTAGVVEGNWSVSSGSSWNLTNAVTEISADGFFASSSRVKIRPSLILDFANSKTLDPRVSFTRASVATCYNAQGVLTTVANNQPRFDHSLTGNSKGLIIEESRENVLKFATTFATWTQSNFNTPTIVANGAPTKGAAIQFNSAGGFDGVLSLPISVSTSSLYIFSIWTKFVSGPAATISISLDNTIWTTMNIVSTLTRYTFPATQSSSPTPTLYIKVPANSSIILWGAQYEQVGSATTGFATSFIKTDWETTSTTSNTITNGFTGTKTFTVLANSYNTVEKIPDTAAIIVTGTTGNTFVGTVASHIGTTLTVTVASVTGTGTFASWTIQAGLKQTRELEYASITGTNFSSWYRNDQGTIIVNATIAATRTGNYNTVKLQSTTDANSIVLGCTAASGVLTFNSFSSSAISPISFTGYTDTDTVINKIVSSTASSATSYNSKSGFVVTFTLSTTLTVAPTIGSWYKVVGNSNPLYNGEFQVIDSTFTTVNMFYLTDPGLYSSTGTVMFIPVKLAVTHGIAYNAGACYYGYNGNAVQTDNDVSIDSNISSLIIGNSTTGIGVQYIARITYYPSQLSDVEMPRMTTQ